MLVEDGIRDDDGNGGLTAATVDPAVVEAALAETLTYLPSDQVRLTVRAKWAMDGAATRAEAAAQLRRLASELAEAARHGWELTDPVSDGDGEVEHRRTVQRLRELLIGRFREHGVTVGADASSTTS